MTSPVAAPLLLEPIPVERPWGDRRLVRACGKRFPPEARIGESWETGNEARVRSGPLAGRTLGELVAQFGAELLGQRGRAASEPFGDFPLLIKLIDADDVLSVQVHPDDEQAAPLGQRGKTEAWHILAADPGAELIVGLTEPLDPPALRQRIARGDLPQVLAHLPVQPGDTVVVPAGTLHAIGPGILLYEIQEQSDVTYRFYDWGRVDTQGRGRPLHIEEGLAVLRPERRAQRTRPLPLDDWRSMLAACRYFLLERWAIADRRALTRQPDQTPLVLTCLEGTLVIQTGRDELHLGRGETALVPATVASFALTGPATVLAASIPDLRHDVVQPLRAAGYDDAAIAQLAGETGDLAPVLAANWSGERRS